MWSGTEVARRRATAGAERPLRRLGAIAALVFCAATSGPAQQQPSAAPPVLKADTTAVVVDVIVTDRKGRHAAGLSAGDFRLYEDNTPQTIATFVQPARADRPRAADGRASAPTPRVAEQTRAPQLITLVMDLGDLHYENLKQACAAASKFVETTIAAGNSIAIYWVDASLHLGVPFTQDKPKALDVLARLSVHVPFGRSTARERERTQNEIDDLFTALYPETLAGGVPKYKNLDPMQGGGKGGRLSTAQEIQMDTQREQMRELNMLRSWLTISSALQARAVFVALRAMAFAYRELPGRKSVVVFSEGFLHAPAAGSEMQAVVDAANRANMAIYVIDASGANSGLSADARSPDMTGGKRSTEDFSILGPDARSAGMNQFDWLQTVGSDLHSDLGLVANATGGFLVKDTNDLAPALDRVVEDGSEFYTLVYYPSNHNYDGAFRKIKVELAERGYHTRYRQGYWALPPGREIMMTPAAAQLLASIESGERKSAFAPQLNAVMVSSADGRFGVSAAVSMPGKLVPFEKWKNQFLAGVSVLLVARDRQGQLLAIHERYGDVRLTPTERDEFSSKIFNMQGHVPIAELEPVSVQAIVRFADGTVGISRQKEINPAANSSDLRLTNLVLSDQEEDAECSADPLDPLCVKGVRILLPAQAQFASSTRLFVYCSLLGVSLDEAQRPGLGVTFSLGTGDTLSRFKPERIQATPGNVPHTLLLLASFDLQPLQPGKYTLEMTAEDTIRSVRVTERAAFTVR